MLSSDYFSDDQGFLWVQPDGPNTAVYPLFCHDVDTLDEALGGLSVRFCQNADGVWQIAHRSQASPGLVSFTMETWLAKTRGWLQRQIERRCPIPVYIHHAQCPPADAFLNYDAGQVVHFTNIVGKHKSNLVRQRADAEAATETVGMSFDFEGYPAPEYWTLAETERTVADAQDLRDIAFCNVPNCYGDCGAAENECTDGVIVADCDTGISVADVWWTTDRGVTWAASAATGWANTVNISTVVCFHTDYNAVRAIVFNGNTLGAAPMECRYTDNSGANWTTVVIGATNTEAAPHGGSSFALNHYNIWVGTDAAHVYYSSDGGATWTLQLTSSAAADDFYAIHFVDENYGCAVGGQTGAASAFYYTTDGGEHWNRRTGPAAVILNGVAVLDSQHVWVTTETGLLYYSNDMGQNWTQRVLPVPAGYAVQEVGDVSFLDHHMGAVVGLLRTSTNDYPTVWYTRNGGYDWEYIRHGTVISGAATHFGMDSVWICSYNQIFSVGEADASFGTCLEYEIGGVP